MIYCPNCGTKLNAVDMICSNCGQMQATTRLDQLHGRLQEYISCETAITTGAQEYFIGSRRLTRANLREISDMIKYLEKEIANEQSKAAGKGRNRVFGVIPRDF